MEGHDVNVTDPPYDDDQGGTFFPGRLVMWDELTHDEVAAFETDLEAARDERDMSAVSKPTRAS